MATPSSGTGVHTPVCAPTCIFCKIIRGDAPAYVVSDTEHSVAFLDAYPATRGHVLVVPKVHAESVVDVPDHELADLMAVCQRVGRASLSTTSATGFNLLQNNGTSAGQEVMHAHFHVIPRYAGDGLRSVLSKKSSTTATSLASMYTDPAAFARDLRTAASAAGSAR